MTESVRDGETAEGRAANYQCTRRVLGSPMQPPNIAETLTSSRFVRTPDQNARLAALSEIGMEPAASYKGAGG